MNKSIKQILKKNLKNIKTVLQIFLHMTINIIGFYCSVATGVLHHNCPVFFKYFY